ncbi:aminoglycoside phosphotransferase family protein [Actinopolymorpha sp. B11F2]|uniref:aminoglycoside phosphotransferase family protein n=1 Tax=Actinopolymorpha sp. B11F2 TaxID=3160862 RepID=UPI0032E428A7
MNDATDTTDHTDPAVVRTRHVVSAINHLHGLHFELRGRCEGGMNGGAWILVDPAGGHAILKCRDDDPASRKPRLLGMVDALRATGYPTPRWIVAGVTEARTSYHVQELVSGQPGDPLTAESVAPLVDVIERQAGLDPDPGHDWSDYISAVVLDQHPDGPRPFLQTLGQPGRDLLTHFDQVLAPHGAVQLPGGDMVHGDFNSCNVMMEDGRVTGVIDIEALGSGTRVVDYAWLLREAYVETDSAEVRQLIRRAGEAVAGPGPLAFCVAATAFDIVRFQVVRDDPRNVPGVLASLHLLADDFARPL